jgi:hypothetical protein
LRSGKMLDRLPVLLERMADMLVRFLDTVQAAHVGFLDAGTFEGLTEPTTRGTGDWRASISIKPATATWLTPSLNFQQSPMASPWRSWQKPCGNAQDAATYAPRHAAYDMAKMVGKMLVRRIERSRRYAVDPPGLRTLCAYLLLREKIIKPLLAGVVRPRGLPPKVVAPLDRHYVALRDELQRALQTIGLAAA